MRCYLIVTLLAMASLVSALPAALQGVERKASNKGNKSRPAPSKVNPVTASASWDNMFAPTRNFKFELRKGARVQVTDWTLMGKIERFLSFGHSFGALKQRISDRDAKSWRYLRTKMRIMFLRNKCETVYNVVAGTWVTCCLLLDQKAKQKEGKVGFCASHQSIGLPNPCRPPVEGFDFTKKLGKIVRRSAVLPDRWNVRKWSCPEKGGVSLTSKKVVQTKEAERTALETAQSVRDFDDELFFEVYDPSTGEDPCAATLEWFALSCFSACCNNPFLSASPFCRQNSWDCY